MPAAPRTSSRCSPTRGSTSRSGVHSAASRPLSRRPRPRALTPVPGRGGWTRGRRSSGRAGTRFLLVSRRTSRWERGLWGWHCPSASGINSLAAPEGGVLFYWFLKYVAIGPVVKLVFRPQVEGVDNVPRSGAAILASNHLAAADWIFMPISLRRRVTFLAKAEYFTGTGVKGWAQRVFFAGSGQVPIDRTDASAAEDAIRTGIRILREGKLLGIYPEGTRSPDGRLYRGKTGVARMALDTGAPVVPVAMTYRRRRIPFGDTP